jgi:hypothetical protein
MIPRKSGDLLPVLLAPLFISEDEIKYLLICIYVTVLIDERKRLSESKSLQ